MNTVDQIRVLLKYLGLRNLKKTSYLLLSLSVFVCAFIASSLDYFSFAVKQSLDDDIKKFLGAPMVIRSNLPIDNAWWQELPIEPVETVSIVTGVIASDKHSSVTLKAVSNNYPLQGSITVSNGGLEKAITKGPEPGNTWLDARALADLGVTLGDSVTIGVERFTITQQIVLEPDRLTQLQPFLPRVIINLKDLAKTGIRLDLGRAEFRYLISPSPEVATSVHANLANLSDSNSIEVLTPDSGQHPFSSVSLRVERFLSLVIVLVLLLCGSAVAVLSGHAVKQYVISSSVLRSMGVDQHAVGMSILLQLILISLASSLLACLASWAIQPLIHQSLESYITLSSVDFSLRSLAYVSSISMLIIVIFVVPKIRTLTNISAVSVLQGNDQFSAPPSVLHITVSLFCIGFLVWRSSDNTQLTIMLSLGIILIVALSLFFGWSLCKLSGYSYRFFSGTKRIALRSIGRKPTRHMTSMVTLAIAIMAIMITTMLRGSFINTYHVSRLDNNGNYVFSGLPIDQKQGFTDLVESHEAVIKSRSPVLLAHLVKINGKPIDDVLTSESDTREELRSPVRLSWSEALPENNELLSGSWPQNGNQVSVDSEFLSDLGLSLGDELGFRINTSIHTATISSSRGMKSGGSSFMFWFMFTPDALSNYSKYYQEIGGIQIDQDPNKLLGLISYQFPGVLMTELERQIQSIKRTMIAITGSINVILGLLLVATMTVIFASIFISSHEKIFEMNLLRALGLNRLKCVLLNTFEQCYVSIVACLVGLASALAISAVMFQALFGLPYEIDYGLIVLLLGVATLISAFIGFFIGIFSTNQNVGNS